MKALCPTCPHRRGEEGGTLGRLVADGGMKVEHGFNTVLHPCHEKPAVPCRGNARELVLRKAGKCHLDSLRLYQTLNGIEHPPNGVVRG